MSIRLSDEARRDLHAEAVALRRAFHAEPEVAFEEFDTQRAVTRYLSDLGIEFTADGLGTGVIAVVRGEATGAPVDVAFRAELDALPVGDEKDVAYRSRRAGVSHACGHDAHLAALLVVARALQQTREQWAGRVTLLFQPAEEMPPGGALGLISSGMLPESTRVYGAHLASDIPVGRVEITAGPVQSANDRFDIVVTGVGGHAATPEFSRDALLAASAIVVELQSVVSRSVAPLESGVVSIGTFSAGAEFNVIAERAQLSGTVRTHEAPVRDRVIRAIERIARGVADAHGCEAAVAWTRGYPAVVNDPDHAARVLEVLRAALPAEVVRASRPRMESDDFAYYLQRNPGNFFFVGSGGQAPATRLPHHNPGFDIDERAIGTIVDAYLALVAESGRLSA